MLNGSYAEWERPEFLGASICWIRKKHVLLPGCSEWKRGKREIILLRTQARDDGVSLRLWHLCAPQIYIAVVLIFTEITVFLSTFPYNLWLPGWLLLRHEYKTCALVNGPVHAARSSPAYGSGTLSLLSHLLKMCYVGKKMESRMKSTSGSGNET